MNKSELIAAVAERDGLTKTAAAKTVATILDAVGDALRNGENVVIAGFGTFAVSKRASRKGRNPTNGAEITIPARKVPVFKAGKALKEKVA